MRAAYVRTQHEFGVGAFGTALVVYIKGQTPTGGVCPNARTAGKGGRESKLNLFGIPILLPNKGRGMRIMRGPLVLCFEWFALAMRHL